MAVRQLLKDILRFGRPRAAPAIALITAGALLETAGVLLLVPIVQVLLGDGGGLGEAPDRLLNALGLLSVEWRIGILLLGFAALVALRFVVQLRREQVLARLRVDFIVDLRARAFRSLSDIPWAELSGRGHGRIGHALARDIDRVSQSVGIVLSGGLAVIQIAVQLTVSMMLAPIITGGIVLFGAGAFAAFRGLRRRAARQGKALTEADYALFNSATSYIRALKQARAHGLEEDYADAFTRAARRVGDELLRQDRDYALALFGVQATVAVLGLAAVAAGVFVVPVTPERLIVVILLLGRLTGPFQTVQMATQQLAYAAAAYRSVHELTGHGGRQPVARPRYPGLDRAPEIAFRGVSFAAAESEILAAIDCRIEAGRFVALIGHSGAGKSLFCDLAVGLLEPQWGSVELDGRPLAGPAVYSLRESLAYVGQDPVVFEDSLRANLTWGCGEVADEEIWRALEAVHADHLARGLAGGLDGSMRSGGSRFSGGERQRFRLAHAVLRRPRMMVLDEATNALDEHAERTVLRGLRQAAPAATVLMVTHRLSSLEVADRVLVLDRGSLVWSGAPAELPLLDRLRL